MGPTGQQADLSGQQVGLSGQQAGPSGQQRMKVQEMEEEMQDRVDREAGLEPIKANLGMDPDAIVKMKQIPKKKKGAKSPIPDSMKDAGPTPRDLSETSEQLMH